MMINSFKTFGPNGDTMVQEGGSIDSILATHTTRAAVAILNQNFITDKTNQKVKEDQSKKVITFQPL